jgi:dipeptidyl aminopeptidase/acylaminoacyl peptidase
MTFRRRPLTRLAVVAALLASDPWAMAALPEAAAPAASSAAAPRAPVARLPVERFASLPLLSQVALSPDGQRFSALLNEAGQTVLVTRAVSGQQPMKAVLTSDNKEVFFNWVRWVSDERLLVSIRFASRRNFVATVETRLISVRPDGTGLTSLVRNAPRPGMLAGTPSQQIQDRVVDMLQGDGQHVLMALSEPERVLPAVYKVNIETGERRMVKSPERGVYQWTTDATHRVRVGLRSTGNAWEVLASDPDGKNWRTLWSFGDTEDAVWPMGFGLDPQELYVRAHHEGRLAVFSVRLDDPALPRRLRLADPKVDVEGQLMHSPVTGEVVGLRGSGTDDAEGGSRSELWSPAWQALAREVDGRMPPGSDNRLRGMSRDERRYLVYTSGNGRPGRYFLGDRDTGQLSLLGETHPNLPPELLVGKHLQSIQSRDGLALNAFLTLPAGRARGDGLGPLPMVLLPHGGAHSRDGDDFDAWTEFLANRGLAVLQVNFRGSSGYGHAFRSAGLKRWGLEMQDDLTDAVRWSVDQGVSDPKRICIVGASYGGYAALMGAVKTPELYRCAVSFAGVSDVLDLIDHQSDYIGGRAAAERLIGKAWGDRERLKATSPALHAERIAAPVLLLHGSADRVVPVEQSRVMAKALKRAGKPHRYIEQEGGDHDLSREAHQVEFFKALEVFLDEHLRAAPARP